MMRPAWTRWLDRAVLLLTRVSGRIVGRPSEKLLHELASVDRAGSTAQWAESPMAKASAHTATGQAAFESGALGEALHHFGVAIECAPEARWAWHGRGDALHLSGQHEAALEAYSHAAGLDAGCGLHHAGRSNALRSLDREEEAEASWAMALKMDPSLIWMRQD
jgi:tetratricopeptide (TPR) repeat protein